MFIPLEAIIAVAIIWLLCGVFAAGAFLDHLRKTGRVPKSAQALVWVMSIGTGPIALMATTLALALEI